MSIKEEVLRWLGVLFILASPFLSNAYVLVTGIMLVLIGIEFEFIEVYRMFGNKNNGFASGVCYWCGYKADLTEIEGDKPFCSKKCKVEYKRAKKEGLLEEVA